MVLKLDENFRRVWIVIVAIRAVRSVALEFFLVMEHHPIVDHRHVRDFRDAHVPGRSLPGAQRNLLADVSGGDFSRGERSVLRARGTEPLASLRLSRDQRRAG